jgi:hypothetical protein
VVKKKPRIAYSPFSSSWAIPVSIAAILILSISIVPLMQESQDLSDLNQLSDEYKPARQKMDAETGLIEKRQYDKQPTLKKAPKSSVSPQEATSSGETRTTAKDAITPAPEMKNKIMAPASAPKPIMELEESQKEQSRSYSVPSEPIQRKLEKQGPEQKLKDKARLDSDPVVRESVGITGSAMIILSPDDWIKKIKELQEAGKTEEAKKSLEEFKKHYPDYPIDKILDIN